MAARSVDAIEPLECVTQPPQGALAPLADRRSAVEAALFPKRCHERFLIALGQGAHCGDRAINEHVLLRVCFERAVRRLWCEVLGHLAPTRTLAKDRAALPAGDRQGPG